MKKLLIAALLLFSTNAYALDLNIWAGQYFADQNMGVLGSINPRFSQGMTVKETFLWGYLSPYIGYETKMDAQNKDSALGVTSSFHPNRIAYTVGADVNLYRGFYLNFEHMCDHSIGGGIDRQYSYVGFGYRTKYEVFK